MSRNNRTDIELLCPRCGGKNVSYHHSANDDIIGKMVHFMICDGCGKYFTMKNCPERYKPKPYNLKDVPESIWVMARESVKPCSDCPGRVSRDKCKEINEMSECAAASSNTGTGEYATDIDDSGMIAAGRVSWMMDAFFLGFERSPRRLRENKAWQVFCNALRDAGMGSQFSIMIEDDDFDLGRIMASIPDHRNADDFMTEMRKIEPGDMEEMIKIALSCARESREIDDDLHARLDRASDEERDKIFKEWKKRVDHEWK